MIKRLGDIVLIQLSSIDSNIYILGDTVIDSGTGFNFARLRDVLRIIKMDMNSIKQVINTHGHFDHIGGNGFFLEAKVAIHKQDAGIIEKGDEDLSAADYFDGKLHPKKVDRILSEGDVIKIGKNELEVIHTPGHTLGSICLYDKKSGLLFSGDTCFSTAIGRCDFANSDPDLMAESLRKLSGLKIKNVYPGHGDPFPKAALDKVLKMSVPEFMQKIEEGEVDEDFV
jgi:glyoxylase-like metal-dependent hydrolase (beta-lactamase superfamily II)